ncbi:hypothetical protein ACE6H2_023544 [Prunus campanulata]
MAMLIGYTQCGRIEEASQLFHAMPIKSVVACNAIILGYGQNGEVAKAREVFDIMRERDDRTWSATIKVYERKGFELETLDFRAGKVKEAMDLIKKMSVEADAIVLHYVDEEEKAHSLSYHSKKLAIAYGLLKVPQGMPIWVIKKLRVCEDCHSAIKLISKVMGREIILRDANRFHHFKDGLFSCRDCW